MSSRWQNKLKGGLCCALKHLTSILDDEIGVEAWKWQTLRLLEPPEDRNHPEFGRIQATRKATKEAREAARECLLNMFLDGPVSILISHREEKKMLRDLQSIFDTCGEVSYRIGTQRRFLCAYGIEDLPDTYSTEATNMVIDDSQRTLKLDKWTVEGCPILVVVHPQVLLVGDSDGTDFSEETAKTWVQAKVWAGPAPIVQNPR